MATQVKSIGLTPAQTRQLQSIVNSNPQYAQSYSTGVSAASAPATNPHDAPGYNPATDPMSSAYGKTPTPQPVPTQPITPQTNAPTTPITAPNAAQVNTPNAQMDMAAAIAGKGSALTSAEMANPQTIQDLAGQYRQRLAATKQVAPAPDTQGAAEAIMQGSQTQPETPSIVGDLMEYDNNFDSILTGYDELMAPMTQKVSLMDEYNQLSQNLGLPAINAELINEKNIIEGTEDDIRNEVMATGGFATDSQVLALANARNKSLIKNYNALLDTKNNAEQQLTTMMNLSIQDRQMASAEFDRKLNFAFKVAEFKQTAINNAVEGYNNIIKNVGYEGLYSMTGGDPTAVSRIEKTLGLGMGGLQRVASLPPPPLSELDKAKLAQTQAEIAKTYAETAKIKAESPTSPESIAIQQQTVNNQVEVANTVLNKVNQANNLIGRLSTGFVGNVLQHVGGTKAKDLQGMLDTMKANLAFSELQKMRDASKTGGALGQVSEGEERLLSSTVASLDIGQSPQQLKTSLAEIKTHYINWLAIQGFSVAPNGDIIKIQ